MSKFCLTADQKNAVYTRSSSILVSAAAGSGKTRVLTERLMSYVTDKKDPKDIRSFLIITYTRAAAAELRSRILKELSERAAAEPENRRLRRQSTLCYRAQIGTIHSFCTEILREHCHKVNLTPDFRVGDEDKCHELKEKALNKVIENAYEKICEDSDFASLADSVGAGRDDSRLASTILELHEKMQSHPYPEKWADLQLSSLDVSGFSDASETIWGQELIENAKQTTNFWLKKLEDIWYFLNSNQSQNAPIISAYGDSLCETMESLRSLIISFNYGWDSVRNSFPIPFPRLKPLKNYEYEDRKKALLSAREACKEAMQNLKVVFYSSSKELLCDLSSTAPAMRSLLNLTIEFNRTYSSEKRRLNLVDFSDLEHFAVTLLCNEETGNPTETAIEISKRYTEIMVDEYQDVNAVQDLIFRCISNNCNNIFMVGDVKQSIYRFRLADPTIFIKKYQNYKDLSNAQENEPKKIMLQNNFRSDLNILLACNHVFSNIMSESLGEINYDRNSALHPPEDIRPPRGKALVTVLSVPQTDDGEGRPDKTYLEAKMVANSIKNLISSGETIMENGEERKIRYEDIVILLRSPNSAGAVFRRAMSEYGIPVLSEQAGGFFESPEILIVTSFLSVIDNPHRDIPLAAVLSSPVFGFTADELSLIRAANKNSDFFTAVTEFADSNNKCADFINTLSELRALSSDIGIYDVLCLIYDRFGLPALCSAMKGSYSCSQNLSLLLDCAAKFEESGYRGLYSFLNHLKRMEERGEDPAKPSGSDVNAVSIMSIHKSKGLEFPVVFLADTSRKFNTNDTRSRVLIHPKLGLGCKVTNTKRGIEYPTLARRAIDSRLNFEMLSEEMRVLYVAMTRSKERLYISCTAKDPEALIEKLKENLSSPINPEILRSAQSMSHWLISAALIDNGGVLDLKIESPQRFEATETDLETQPLETHIIQKEKLTELEEKLGFCYPFKNITKLPTKLTATSIPQEDLDLEAAPIIREHSRIFRLPDFMRAERPLTGAELGSATHIVMQFIDFSRTETLSDIENEIIRICSLGQLTEKQSKAVDKNALLRFFSSEVGKRIKSADCVWRELRFSILCPADKFFESSEGEEIMLQGIVDCCIEEKGELTIIDYKTDSVTTETLSDVAEHYKKQISTYAYAMSRMLKKPVCSCLLCFLQSGLVSEIIP